jgi:hypothetical protein
MPKITNRQIAKFVADRGSFQANSCRAEWLDYMPSTGYLPEVEKDKLRQFIAGKADTVNAEVYIVFSYGTPIAWGDSETLYMPDHKYSVTTSKTQSYVRQGMTGSEFEAHKAQNPKAWA